MADWEVWEQVKGHGVTRQEADAVAADLGKLCTVRVQRMPDNAGDWYLVLVLQQYVQRARDFWAGWDAGRKHRESR
jgi:hypothetical protein